MGNESGTLEKPESSWHRLERLELGFCGRGFGPEAVRALLAGGAAGGNAGALPGLRSLALKDAYRLEDADLHRLLAAAPNLEQLRLANCSRLQDAAQLARLAPHLRCAFLIGPTAPACRTRMLFLEMAGMEHKPYHRSL